MKTCFIISLWVVVTVVQCGLVGALETNRRSLFVAAKASFQSPSSKIPHQLQNRKTTSANQNRNSLIRFDEKAVVSDFFSRDSRLGFIRKVYSIFGLQTLTTSGMIYFAIKNMKFASFLLKNKEQIFLLGPLVSLAIVSLLSFSQSLRHAFPVNLFLLMILTIAESFSLSTVSLFIEPRLIFSALVYTFISFVGITVYTFQNKPFYDLNATGNVLISAMTTIILGSLLNNWLFRLPMIENILLMGSAIAFAGLIAWDTQRIVSGKKKKRKNASSPHDSPVSSSNAYYSSKDYILAAMDLYLDFAGFLKVIIQILMKVNEADKKKKNGNSED
jgi:FtsH-binding integral membrane protein